MNQLKPLVFLLLLLAANMGTMCLASENQEGISTSTTNSEPGIQIIQNLCKPEELAAILSINIKPEVIDIHTRCLSRLSQDEFSELLERGATQRVTNNRPDSKQNTVLFGIQAELDFGNSRRLQLGESNAGHAMANLSTMNEEPCWSVQVSQTGRLNTTDPAAPWPELPDVLFDADCLALGIRTGNQLHLISDKDPHVIETDTQRISVTPHKTQAQATNRKSIERAANKISLNSAFKPCGKKYTLDGWMSFITPKTLILDFECSRGTSSIDNQTPQRRSIGILHGRQGIASTEPLNSLTRLRSMNAEKLAMTAPGQKKHEEVVLFHHPDESICGKISVRANSPNPFPKDLKLKPRYWFDLIEIAFNPSCDFALVKVLDQVAFVPLNTENSIVLYGIRIQSFSTVHQTRESR